MNNMAASSVKKRHKDFGAGRKVGNLPPISFDLHGETFNALPQIQGATLIDLVAKSQSDDPATSAEVITTFFEQVLDDESYARFQDLTHSKTKFVDVETLGEITGWLVEEYTNRPEAQPGA